MSIQTILEEIRTTRHSILRKSPFKFHYDRKTITEGSNFREKLINSLNSDQQKLDRSMLKPQEMRELTDSQTRLKVARKGMVSGDNSLKPK